MSELTDAEKAFIEKAITESVRPSELIYLIWYGRASSKDVNELYESLKLVTKEVVRYAAQELIK